MLEVRWKEEKTIVDRILALRASKTQRAIDGKEPIKEHLLITRYNPSRVQEGQMLSLEDIQDILRSNHGPPSSSS